jgi:uncharacterized membrane protein
MITKEITLEKVQVACNYFLTKDFLMEAKVDAYLDKITQTMELRLKAFVWATPEKSFEHSWPKSAWQHFKLEYFPKWLLKHFPCKMDTVIYKVREVFPDYRNISNNSTMWLRIAKPAKYMP